jgi:hypothetical protein
LGFQEVVGEAVGEGGGVMGNVVGAFKGGALEGGDFPEGGGEELEGDGVGGGENTAGRFFNLLCGKKLG